MSEVKREKLPMELIKRLADGCNPAYDENGKDLSYDYEELIASMAQHVLELSAKLEIVNTLMDAATELNNLAKENTEKLVAERDALAKLVNAMADIGDLIKSQDNRCTDQPFFAVLTKRELPAAEDYDYDRIIFVHPDRDYEEADDRTYRRLEALDEGGRDLRGWQRLAVKKVEEFRVGCFTEQGCKDYISRNGHNLNEPFIYAYGSYRNNEFQEVRNFLIEAANLRAGRKG